MKTGGVMHFGMEVLFWKAKLASKKKKARGPNIKVEGFFKRRQYKYYNFKRGLIIKIESP